MKAKILVTGGMGYIGSHTIVDLIEHGYDVVSVDNCSRADGNALHGIRAITQQNVRNYQIDLCNPDEVLNMFQQEENIVGIIHFAAYKLVGESVSEPLMYYRNNLNSLMNMLDCAKQFHVRHFVFSSSCSVYGNVDELPVTESTPLAKPECPYAATKQMGEQILFDMAKVMQTQMVLLRYFNPVGAHASGHLGEVPFGRPNNLVPVITQTAIGLQESMRVWGGDYDTRDGSCIRDYIHVMDIAHAHTLAIDYLMNATQQQQVEIFNVGSGNGVSVLEAIQAFEKVSGLALNYTIGPRREGDVVAIYADNSLIRSRLGWQPSRSLDEMMRSAWIWQQKLAQMPQQQGL